MTALTDSHQPTARGIRGAHPDFTHAGLFLRLAAFVLDLIVIVLLSLPLPFLGLALILDGETHASSPLLRFLETSPMWISALYSIPVMAFWGRTPGMWAMGISVVQASGTAPGLTRAVLRFIIFSLPTGLLVLASHLSRHKQGLHDFLSGTYVIQDVAPQLDHAPSPRRICVLALSLCMFAIVYVFAAALCFFRMPTELFRWETLRLELPSLTLAAADISKSAIDASPAIFAFGVAVLCLALISLQWIPSARMRIRCNGLRGAAFGSLMLVPLALTVILILVAFLICFSIELCNGMYASYLPAG